MRIKTCLVFGLLLFGLSVQAAALAGVIPVKVAEKQGRYFLEREGEPYAIKGAGLEYSDVAVFASHGGNSIRTWRTDNAQSSGLEVLDEAAEHGVTVALCIEIGRERHGFDYDDEEAVAAQLEYARGEVMKYKDHPALLVWMIGNEANLRFENPKVFDAINDISKMIHEVDGNHPTTTALAGFNAELAGLIDTRSSDLDFVSIQMYGDIVNLPRYLDEIGFDKPYMVTEWGAIGHWEVRKTAWGAPVEQNSSEKAANYLKSYQVAIASDPDHVLGSYVFLWGQKQERTPTWYGMFLADGTETETIDTMHYIWTGAWPDNRSPQIDVLRLDSRTSAEDIVLKAGGSYDAEVITQDPDGDNLSYRWEVLRESEATQDGGDKEEIPEAVSNLFGKADSERVDFKAPEVAGAYRLFVYVYDGQGHAGHANIPFLVK
ncbi:glycoside hydrolase family 2 TIM barrel-domain containing protein [Pseudomonadota bacterium]